jgi:hypothetical protein
MLSTYDRIIFWSNFVPGEVLVVKKSFNMKRGIAITGVLGTVVAAGAAYAAVRFEETTAPGAMIGSVPVGGLNKEQAAFRLRQWWETEKLKEIQLKVPGSDKVYTDRASKLGIRLDDVAETCGKPFKIAFSARATAKKFSRYSSLMNRLSNHSRSLLLKT